MNGVAARDVARYLALSTGITAVYYLLGRLGLLMMLPPYQAAPLYPAAGWGLAVLLALGRRYLPAVALGSFVVQATTMSTPPALLLPLSLGIGLGAAAQAATGAWLVRRWCGHPLMLALPRDVARYLAAAALAGVISPSCATLALMLTGLITAEQMAPVWAVRWTGDLVGVLLATPITLAFIGQPRAAWAPRRLSVALPMVLTTLLVALGVAATLDWDRQRQRADFTRDASGVAQDVAARLRESLLALEGAHGLVRVLPQPTREAFALATDGFLAEDSPLIALGLAVRVPRDAVARFDAEAAADRFPAGYHAHDRTRAGDVRPPPDEDMVAIRLIEPLSRNLAALGVNLRSVPGSRAATERATATGRPAASAGIQLSQDRDGAVGVVIYQPIYREGAPQGFVFATLRPDLLLSRMAAHWPERLAACLVDLEPGASQIRLAGRPGCEAVQRADTATLPLVKLPLTFAGRNWEVRVYDLPGFVLTPDRSWAFALVGLLATAMVGALLLVMSGRTQHIEAVVQERTEALAREIAARAADEHALRQSEQRFRSIFETAPIGIAFAGLNGALQEVNARFCELVGRPASALIGRRGIDVTHPDDCQEDIRLARRLLSGELPLYRRVKRYVRPDGSVVHARALVSLLRGPDGRPHRMVGVVEDITDLHRVEELDRAREAAEAANQAKNEFLSRMSHELRTPMNAILGFTQLMQMDASQPLPPAQRHRAHQIAQAGWHLLAMINDTLDLSRIETGTLQLTQAPLELPPLVARAVALVHPGVIALGLTVQQRLEADARCVVGDATRITQVLANLLGNAVKYNRPGGHIFIEASRPEPGWVEVAVQDTGLGLTEAQRADLFQPFNRLGREDSGLPGTGIGLVISQRLAEMMGGSLRADATPPPGARFVLRLPAAPDDTPPNSPTALPDTAPARPAPSRRVLYVEDNALNADVMRGVLGQRADLALEVVSTAAACFDAQLARPADLLLLDWQLPDADGLTLLRRLQEAGRAPPAVIVVSAHALPEQMDQALAAGAHHYLTKPLDVRQLLALVDDLLAPSRHTTSAE